MSKTKAFGYIKASGTEENREEKQIAAIKKYANARDIEIVRFYQDKETTRENCTLSKLLLDLEGNDQGIKMVLVEKLDQLAQDLTVQAAIMWDLKSQGFQVVCAVEDNVWKFWGKTPGCSN